MRSLRALTLNIWHREAPWERRREIIRKGFAELDPDFIGLQEVLELDLGGNRTSQAQELIEGTPYQYVFGCAQMMMPGLEFGNAVLSKHPILASETLRLPGEESGETRCVVYARLGTPFGEVPVFVTHLNWKLHQGSVRVRQVKRLVELIEERAPVGKGFPPVLMGDFNAEPESDEIRWLRGHATLEGRSVYFADAWVYGGDGSPGYTFDRRNPYAARAHEPPRRLDYIFVRGPDSQWNGEPLSTRLVLDAPEEGVWASDHFGLLSEISATRSRAP
ncbi:MAG: endonuclease/exonuclease/phosphatase family protein [Myxococcales bacterium]